MDNGSLDPVTPGLTQPVQPDQDRWYDVSTRG